MKAQRGMLALVIAHAFEKTLHPELTCCISWTRAEAIKLADLRTKHLNTRVVLMHGGRELHESRYVVIYRVFQPRVGVKQAIRLIAYRPERNWMEGCMCILSCALNTLLVIHIVDR